MLELKHMGKVIRNKKIIIFLIVLFLFLGFLFTFKVLAQSAIPACNEDCENCPNPVECGLSDSRCAWDNSVGRCCDQLQTNWPDSPMGTELSSCATLPLLIKYLYEWGVLLGGLAAFIALIMAGFQYLTSVGDPTKMREARGRITSAIGGLILLLSSWLVLNTINPELTTFHNITFDPNRIPSGPSALTPFEEEPACNFAVAYENKDYNFVPGDETILPNRLDGFKKIAPWAASLEVKSIDSWKRCDPCTAALVQEEIDKGVPLAERKCIDPDGDGVFYERDCEQRLIDYDRSGDTSVCAAHCDILGAGCGLHDCLAYYKEGGGCTLQLFAASDWFVFWETCGNMMGQVKAKHPSLGEAADQKVECIKLIKHKPGSFQ